MRIAIVNADRQAIEILRGVIEGEAGLDVCWTARDGKEAVARCAADRPDLILMAMHLPAMDGVEATRHIMGTMPCPILVVTATIAGAFSRVYEAMAAGALDAVETPRRVGDGEEIAGAGELLRKIATLGALMAAPLQGASAGKPAPRSLHPSHGGAVPVVAIGSSTGGPHALGVVLSGLPADFPAAVLVVQHLDVRFADNLAHWLSRQTPLDIRLLERPERIRSATVYLAAREAHMVLDGRMRLHYVEAGDGTNHCPSVDRLFESLAILPELTGCGVLLTGMGRDGAAGLLAMRRAGLMTVAQDEDTSVIWGMPGAAVRQQAASAVLPLDRIAPAVVRYIRSLPDPARVSRGASDA
ncbi:chemotaxis response regulator protein-glutamate methylesterase [Methylococcus capsulatus]|uniref:chemotaxis response regulator protein-glutamate methylesterase n=1 Tax=Methylococcus capsulatus TaxID=414 RepID=UPI001C52C89C|nr:chemotaxis response regulator protein-glutamate methylesterase [Methylococcus capsulatus]QXP88401.1 chemotaxis response regulator protein-glutamate methylesterase [Methylococcus capsulatus]QXP94582.1 chemotaxis response regulator protein-glutamate methylesterase [Methylococcus capsulatus]UQN13444.1 chemotaxis response regulator protein-glutamate methylesterase [Methylococcus capsulatus]